VDRLNFGLTLDTGHLLMAGESAAQSAAAAAAAGRLFGLHLNDGHAKLGAEDGLAFGSVHAAGALELVYCASAAAAAAAMARPLIGARRRAAALLTNLPLQPPITHTPHTQGCGAAATRGTCTSTPSR
jgi:hypothetical protein